MHFSKFVIRKGTAAGALLQRAEYGTSHLSTPETNHQELLNLAVRHGGKRNLDVCGAKVGDMFTKPAGDALDLASSAASAKTSQELKSQHSTSPPSTHAILTMLLRMKISGTFQ